MAYVVSTPRSEKVVARQRVSLLDLLSIRRQRRDLARLSDEALRDIGLTRHEADTEARRPFWDIISN